MCARQLVLLDVVLHSAVFALHVALAEHLPVVYVLSKFAVVKNWKSGVRFIIICSIQI